LSKINYQNIDVEQFLQELGLRNVKREGREIFFSCPFEGHSHGDANPSASMQQGTTKCHCFGCGFNGNALSFLAEYENCSPLKAARYIREWLGGGFVEPEGSFKQEIEALLSPKQDNSLVRNKPLDIEELEKRKIDWKKAWGQYTSGESPRDYCDYLFDRGFSWETLEQWNIGWDRISRRITIPYFDGGDLIGFKGRALPDEIDSQNARYKVLGGPEYGFDTYDVSLLLFGLNKLREWPQFFRGDDLIVCEGEFNVMSLHQMELGPAIGISGKHLSDAQIYMLKKIGRRVILFLDDVVDARKAAEKLVKDIPTVFVPEHDLDPADCLSYEGRKQVEYLLDNVQSAIIDEKAFLKQP